MSISIRAPKMPINDIFIHHYNQMDQLIKNISKPIMWLLIWITCAKTMKLPFLLFYNPNQVKILSQSKAMVSWKFDHSSVHWLPKSDQ